MASLTSFLSRLSLCCALLQLASTRANITEFNESRRANSSDDFSTKNLLFIGAVEGKSYFRDMTFYWSWVDARTYCNSVGLQPATVTTVGQYNFLSNADFPSTVYWTGGRNALELRGMSWDTTDAEPSSTLFPALVPPHLNQQYYTCLALVKGPGSIQLQITECAFGQYVLCETA